MLSTLRTITPPRGVILPLLTRSLATAAQPQTRDRSRKEGDISSVFASLSGAEPTPLPSRFADIKTSLIRNHEPAIQASWSRLLSTLRSEVETIASTGSDIFPTIQYEDIQNHSRIQPFATALKKRGAAVIRGVVSPDEALSWKKEIQEHIRANPHTKAFPKDNPAVYELYWSPGQIKARANANVVETQRFLMSFWHSNSQNAPISTEHPVAYADRLRIRTPGDAGFALGACFDLLKPNAS